MTHFRCDGYRKGNVSFIMYDRTYENLIPIHLKCHEKSTDLISCCWLWAKILEILNCAVGTTETVIQFNSILYLIMIIIIIHLLIIIMHV